MHSESGARQAIWVCYKWPAYSHDGCLGKGPIISHSSFTGLVIDVSRDDVSAFHREPHAVPASSARTTGVPE